MNILKKHVLALVLITALIFSIGLLMVFDTTAAEVLDRSLSLSTHHALYKQLLYAGLSILFAVCLWFVGYERLVKWSPVFLCFGICFLVLALVPGVGVQLNGASRWVGFGFFSFQPSEFVKFLIPVYFIHTLTSRDAPLHWKEFYKLLGILLVPIALILIEPDNGTVVMIMVSLVALCFLTKIKWIYWVVPLIAICLMGGLMASQMHHVPDRIRVYLNPELDLRGKGHQPHQARIAAGSGRLLGKGVAESMQKLDYLPEARSDYIAAIYAEEFGFVGIVVLVLLYMAMGYLGFFIALQAHDLRGFYLASILTFIICFQAFLNLGVVCGLLPSKGTNLPLFSQGGSSLLSNVAAICMILSVAKSRMTLLDEKNSNRSRRDRRTSVSRSSTR